MAIYTKIIGTGIYLPTIIISNSYFLNHEFYELNGKRIETPNQAIIEKFEEITCISERRYVEDHLVASDMSIEAAKDAIESSNIDPESIDAILVGHNFGDVPAGLHQKDVMPALATRVKRHLKIKNPHCIAHDVVSGCPSWTQALTIANDYIKCNSAKRVLTIGADTISRVADPHDRDCMIYSDGAGAVLVEGVESEEPVGFITSAWRTDADMGQLLWMGTSSRGEEHLAHRRFVKMTGHKLYLYALSTVPKVVKKSLDQAGLDITDIKKVFIHQANEKLDDAILEGISKLYNTPLDKSIMPMTIRKWGNSGSATVPMLMDEVLKGRMEGQSVNEGDHVIIASVGAGMSINSIIYKF